MARATTKGGVSDPESDAEPRSAKRQSASASKNGAKDNARADDDDQEESDEEEDAEEYEIEKILDAKHGAFAEGRMGYLVKWKGYDDSHNSWVNEKDAEGATDLIKEYWRVHKKGGRKSEPKPKPAAKPRKSSVKEDSDVEEVASSAAGSKKRGRPPKAAAPPETDEEEEDEPVPKQKKQRKSTGAAAKSAGRRKSGADQDDQYADMRKWKDAPSWEHVVDTIDTVERTEAGDLLVYFTLKNNKGHGREKSDVCKKKMPYKLIDFYESNLRWKPTDENAMEE
ncbi:hypothetical protein C8Q78DRAFT_1150116 [Trametes maxima]|nr:hypothetical protein C8Q78DRAFT_1150116 [Trametes maxima]